MLKTRGIVTQIAKESTFNTAPTFTASDVVETISTSVVPKVDMVDRKVITQSLVKQAGLPVRYTTAGAIQVEINVEDSGTDLVGDVLYEAGFGRKESPGAGTGGLIGLEADGTTTANKVSRPQDSTVTGDATLYSIQRVTDDRISVSLKKFVDSGDVVLLSTGTVVEKVTMNFAVADIATAQFDVSGAEYQTLTGQTLPTYNAVTNIPFVGKSGKFTYDGNVIAVTGLSFEITNTVTNVEDINHAGYVDKQIVEREITGSMTLLMEDYSWIDKLKNQTVGEVYLELTSGSHKIGVYLPRVKVQDVSENDNANMLVELAVNFQAEEDVNGDTILLASK